MVLNGDGPAIVHRPRICRAVLPADHRHPAEGPRVGAVDMEVALGDHRDPMRGDAHPERRVESILAAHTVGPRPVAVPPADRAEGHGVARLPRRHTHRSDADRGRAVAVGRLCKVAEVAPAEAVQHLALRGGIEDVARQPVDVVGLQPRVVDGLGDGLDG